MSPRQGECPGATPGSRTIVQIRKPNAARISAYYGRISNVRLDLGFPHRLRVSTRQSLQNSAYSGQHQGSPPASSPKLENRRPEKSRPPKAEKIRSRSFGFMVSDFLRPSVFGLRTFTWGRGRQVMHLPCKQAHVGALPTDSTISLRGE